MLFEPCLQFKENESRHLTLRQLLPDYDESHVQKLCTYFEGFDFFDLANDNIDHISRLSTRSMKPKTRHAEVEEIIELIQNLGISALLKRNAEVYQACCNALWRIGKKYTPLVIAKNKQEMSDNFHLRLKVWTCLYRICSYPCFEKLECGVLDCKEQDFVDGISIIFFGSLMNIAKLKEHPISCSCVTTSWKLLIPSSIDNDVVSVFMKYFDRKYPSKEIDDEFFKTAYANVCSIPPELFVTVFYALFPAFFPNLKKAGALLKIFHSKISPIPEEFYESLINCFSQNVTFIQNCEQLLKDFITKFNNIKDEITINYFPDNFTSIVALIDEYSSPPKYGDDKFQLFLRLFIQSLKDDQTAKTFIELITRFWEKTKAPKNYSYYLMLLATTAKILGPTYVINQVTSLTGDDICPDECLFLRFFVLQRTSQSDFSPTFHQLKPKILATVSNFSLIMQAFPMIAAAHPSEAKLLLSIFSQEVLRSSSPENIQTFLKQIHRFHPQLPAFIFELFQKDLNFDVAFVANFFARQLSVSSIPSMERCFKEKYLTMEFIEKLVEATVRQEKLLIQNFLFGYHMALLYSFTKKFMADTEGKENFVKLMKLISSSSTTEVISEPTEAIKVLDTILNKNAQNAKILLDVYSKRFFEIINEYLLSIPELISNGCGQICAILESDSFVKSSNAFPGSGNNSPLVYILKNFIEKYLIENELKDKEYQINLLKKVNRLKFPAKLLNGYVKFFKDLNDKMEAKIEDLEF